MKVTVIGTGYVGLVTGACLADAGNNVFCLDVNKEKIQKLNEGVIPIFEPGLEPIVRRNERRRAPEVLDRRCGERRARRDPDHRRRHAAGRGRLGRHAARHRRGALVGRTWTVQVVVTKSTVPVGTADKVKHAIIEEHKKRGPGQRLQRRFQPRVPQGGARRSRISCVRTASSSAPTTPRAIALLRQLYAPFQRNRERVLVMGVRSAELTKYAANAMLATRISFMNELANLAEAIGADIEEVRRGIGSDPRIAINSSTPARATAAPASRRT
jgi:UDPglucose 6-dehydrogenase